MNGLGSRANGRRVHPLDACQRLRPVESFERMMVDEPGVESGSWPRRGLLLWSVALVALLGGWLVTGMGIARMRLLTAMIQAGLVGLVVYLVLLVLVLAFLRGRASN
jgi:hypothetical protein